MYPEFITYKIRFNDRDFFQRALHLCNEIDDIDWMDMTFVFDSEVVRDDACIILDKCEIEYKKEG